MILSVCKQLSQNMKIIAVLLFLGGVLAKHEEYAGWKSYFVQPSSQEQLKFLGSIKDVLELDFLGYPAVGRDAVVLVKPQYQAEFIKTLQESEISHRVHVENVVEALRSDDMIIESREEELKRTRNGARIPYDNYQRLAVYDAYLEDVARRFPNRAKVVDAANSFEGRPIKYIKISTTNFEDLSKPVIVLEGGMHAREWISPPTITWAVHKLLENVTEPDLVARFDWILLPIANPDGYEFSFTNNRFWRKTRSTDASPLSSVCPGVDGNRNFDFFWNTVGVSSNPCADNYPGNRPFSEIETRVVRDILEENLSRTALYITMHSFGSMILYPWGHDGTLSNNALALHIVGVQMAEAINRVSLSHFPRYVVGNSVLVIGYVASGASEDYAHHIGVPISYTIELPGLGSGFNGFVLNPRYIEQVCRETWEGIVAGARTAGALYVPLP